jgi:hypothetical protein
LHEYNRVDYLQGGDMTKVQQIESQIETLSREEFVLLRQWFADKDFAKWDVQIAEDATNGKLDFLIEEAMSEKTSSLLRKI